MEYQNLFRSYLEDERNYAFTYLLQYIATFIFGIVSVYKFGTNCFVEDKYFCIVDFMFLTLWTNIHTKQKGLLTRQISLNV